MYYTYNEETKAFGVYTNFKPKKLPKGYKYISKEEYELKQAEISQNEQVEEK